MLADITTANLWFVALIVVIACGVVYLFQHLR